MATKKKIEEVKVAPPGDRVAVMATETGLPLILRADPTTEEVEGFVREHNRRYEAGIPGGPSGIPARKILSAVYYDHEVDMFDSNKTGTEIDLSDVLETN